MSSALWWQGDGGINYRIDLADYSCVSRLVDEDQERALVSTSWSGRSTTIIQHVLPVVEFEIADIGAWTDPAQIALLRNFGEHFRRGGVFGFAAEQSRAWLSYLTIAAAPGGTVLFSSPCVGWAAGSAAIAVGDELVLTQGYPLTRSHGRASAPTLAAGSGATLASPGVILSRDVGAALHARDYYPALTRTNDNAAMRETNDRGVTYSFRFRAQTFSPLLLSGAALWQSMTLTPGATAPPSRRVEGVLAPILGADLFSGPGSPLLGSLYSAEVKTGPSPRRF